MFLCPFLLLRIKNSHLTIFNLEIARKAQTMAQILIMTKYSQYSDNLSVLIISSPVLKTLRTNNQYISSHILKCRIENNFSSLYFIKLKNERYFCPPKAKAPVIFKVKIASTLAFHIQFWVQKSRIPFQISCFL